MRRITSRPLPDADTSRLHLSRELFPPSAPAAEDSGSTGGEREPGTSTGAGNFTRFPTPGTTTSAAAGTAAAGVPERRAGARETTGGASFSVTLGGARPKTERSTSARGSSTGRPRGRPRGSSARGRGESTTRGRGDSTTRGRGDLTRGRGDNTTRGRGRGDLTSPGMVTRSGLVVLPPDEEDKKKKKKK